MTFSSSLTSDRRPLVIDTSVLINLNACTYGERILLAVPDEIFVPEAVVDELTHETSRKNGGHSFLQNMLHAGTAVAAELSDEEYEIFGQLTSNTNSLDDGEAATIAVSVKRNYVPVIDEKKGRARAAGLMTAVPGWSLDLLLHPMVITTLGNSAAIEALYLALRIGRMRIPPETLEHVISLIGEERSVECTCLPGYQERFSTRRI